MYKANQEQLNQSTNINLVGIRQLEIDYFATFFTSFGTQCFFLTAILAGSVSQTPSFHCASGCSLGWQIVYNCSVAIGIGCTSISLLHSVFLAVYAEGLAIRGKEGSMIDAINGMIAEQNSCLRYFAVAVTFFQIQVVALIFIVSDNSYWVYICAGIAGLMSYYTYYCSLRIYNRFKWDYNKSGWDFDQKIDDERDMAELTPELIQDLKLPGGGRGGTAATGRRIDSKDIQELYRESLDEGLLKKDDPKEKKKAVLASKIQQKKPFQNHPPPNNSTPSAPTGRPLSSRKKQLDAIYEADDSSAQSDSSAELRNPPPLPSSTKKKNKGMIHKIRKTMGINKDALKKKAANNENDDKSDSSEIPSLPPPNPMSHLSRSSDKPTYELQDLDASYSSSVQSISGISHNAKGYLKIKLPNPNSLSLSREVWKRHYFLLRGNHLYYYEDEAAYLKDPSKPLNIRPIDLDGYGLHGGIQKSPFPFNIQAIGGDDIRKIWRFQCDNEEEQKYWMEAIQRGINHIKV